MTGTVESTCTSTPAASHSLEPRRDVPAVAPRSRGRAEPSTIMRAQPGAWCSSRTNRSPPGTFRKSGRFSGRMWVWTSIFSKSGAGRRRLRHHRAALLAGALLLVGEEPVEDAAEDPCRRSGSVKNSSCSRDVHFSQYHWSPSFSCGRPLALDDEPDGISASAAASGGRAAGARRSRRRGSGCPRPCRVLDRLQDHVAFELVEELVALVDVVVLAAVRPADDHDDEVVVLADHLVADGRLAAGCRCSSIHRSKFSAFDSMAFLSISA